MAKEKSTDKNTAAPEQHMSAFGGHPLQFHVASVKDGISAAGEPSGTAGQLADLGVTDAEQLVALASIAEVRGGLAAALGLGKQELDSLVKEARKVLPPPLAVQMETPVPPMYSLGAMPPPPYNEPAAAAASLPPDLVEAPPLTASINLIGTMPPIRNQGARGTCVSFALTSIQDYYRRLHGNLSPNFSEQHLYHEVKLIDGSPAACGTWQRFGAQVLANRGQCREVVWAYNPNNPCNNNGVMPATARPDALNYRLGLTSLTPTNAALIRNALASRRPVGISIPVFNSWYLSAATQRTGQITMPLPHEAQVGGHAVCLVGFQDIPSAPGGGYFVLRNSWGTSWASLSPYGAGYGVIPYAYVTGFNWEAFTLVTIAQPADEDGGTDPDTGKERTISIRVKGNVNLIVE